MVWPFKRKSLLDNETMDWHINNFEWLVQNFAEDGALQKAKLILPKPGFFETDGETGKRLADRIFSQVKVYCQIEQWPVRLITHEPIQTPGKSLFEVKHDRQFFGFYLIREDESVEISYAENLVEDIPLLITTLAHEIGHYLVDRCQIEQICDEDEIEFLTDLTSVYMGFGIFAANSAFRRTCWRDDGTGMQGWSMQRHGYLPEADLVFATALFIKCKDLDPREARSCLKPHLAKMLDQALRDLDGRQADIERIRSIEKKFGNRHFNDSAPAPATSIVQKAPELS